MNYKQIDEAKKLVKRTISELPEHVEYSEVFVIWFSKTLQNWKAILSVDGESNLLFEVTHNGDKSETYVDTYSKVSNKAYGYEVR